ncbi:phage tail family protein [Oceanobacillus kimchii]|uniref:distal tail protein Dit n=1 Tax=Oceanobacillus kimchii TaxID=746691 RepID=UPI0021A3F06D|nr:distal tail protein Dit [Oceanobacillus kimchii]MCT1577945.1 phage tail family protein [Oceanobacillus kimchii]MCT2137505.1 phage tail family protein [Oceanobacillus kimchii]
MIFNGADLSPYFKIKSITGRGFTNNQLLITEITGADGAYIHGSKRPPRILGINGDIIAHDRESLRLTVDYLNGVLNVAEDVPIIFPDEPDITYYGRPSESEEGDEYFFKKDGTLTIFCADPNKYGKTDQLDFDTGEIEVKYMGTEKSPPGMEIVLTEETDTLSLFNGDKELRIIYDLSIGDKVDVDFKKRTVFINDTLQMNAISMLAPKFWKLNPGINNIRIEPIAVDAVLKYREVYR